MGYMWDQYHSCVKYEANMRQKSLAQKVVLAEGNSWPGSGSIAYKLKITDKYVIIFQMASQLETTNCNNILLSK